MINSLLLKRTSTNHCCTLLLTAVLAGTSGCGQQSPASSPAARSASRTTNPTSEWTLSEDGAISLRISARPAPPGSDGLLEIVGEFRNESNAPIVVLRPFGDWYVAKAVGLQITRGEKRIPYRGPNVTYVIGANAFAVMQPGEIIADQMLLTVDNFGGLDAPGTYRFRYQYEYNGHWDTTAAAGDSGIRDVWRGKISSESIEVFRE